MEVGGVCSWEKREVLEKGKGMEDLRGGGGVRERGKERGGI